MGYELRTSRSAVKFKSDFLKPFTSPLLAFWQNWLTEFSTVIPHQLEELGAGANLLANWCMGRVDCIQSSNFHRPIAWDYSARYDARLVRK